MSLSNKLEELLSGYIDNQLNADELREVEQALKDPQVQTYLEQLRRNRESLQALAKLPKTAIRPDFAKLVMAQVAAQSAAKPESKVSPTTSSQSSGIDSRILAALVSIAAMLVLAIYFSKTGSNTKQPGSDEIAVQGPRPTDNPLSSNDPQSQDSPQTQDDTASSGSRLVSRSDLAIRYLMTVDVEIPMNQTSETTLGPLLEQFGIQLVKGAKVTDEVKSALDELRVTKAPEDVPLATEVYLLKASLSSLDSVLESIRTDQAKFMNIRFGMAYELPSDPLVDKLSAETKKEVDALSSLMKESSTPILLGKAIANSLVDNQEVKVDQSFAAPLVANNSDVRPSPFESIPEQGKLVSSSRRPKSSLQQQNALDNDEKGFALIFIRQAK